MGGSLVGGGGCWVAVCERVASFVSSQRARHHLVTAFNGTHLTTTTTLNRTNQNICNESKVKRSAPLLSKAPAAKKSLERFVFEVKAFFHELGQKEAVWIGAWCCEVFV